MIAAAYRLRRIKRSVSTLNPFERRHDNADSHYSSAALVTFEAQEDLRRSTMTNGSSIRSENSTGQLSDDGWEALQFNPQVPQWSLKEMMIQEPSVIKNAISELQNKLGQAVQEIERLRDRITKITAGYTDTGSGGVDGPEEESLWRIAWDAFRRGFTLSYFARAGLGLSTRVLQLLRQRNWQELKGWQLVSESSLAYRVDAVRLGLFIGGFASLYQLTHACISRRKQQNVSHAQACIIAGSIAGLTLLVQDAERRRTLALYVAARVAQCWYNSLKARGEWQFLCTSLGPRFGDSILFALATSQVMYAYVMRPYTLPPSYWNFISRTSPIHPTILKAVRRTVRGKAIDISAVNQYISSRGGKELLTTSVLKQIPPYALHPGIQSSFYQAWLTFASSFRKTFPLYFSISVVPFVVLNFRRAARNPFRTLQHALVGATRSTTFLSAFVASYMGAISIHRTFCKGDSKLVYWLAGMAASCSIFIENKSRRAELALYVLPRAVESLYETLLRRRVLPRLPLWEVALFALCMGRLMYYKEHEPETMAPFLGTFISRLVLGSSSSSQTPRRSPSKLTVSALKNPEEESPFSLKRRDSLASREQND